MRPLLAALPLLILFAVPAGAETRTVTLSITGMSCPACPLTVRKALSRVDGVEKAEVSYEKKEAVVTYDDAKTTVEALAKATTDVGYPSELRK